MLQRLGSVTASTDIVLLSTLKCALLSDLVIFLVQANQMRPRQTM